MRRARDIERRYADAPASTPAWMDHGTGNSGPRVQIEEQPNEASEEVVEAWRGSTTEHKEKKRRAGFLWRELIGRLSNGEHVDKIYKYAEHGDSVWAKMLRDINVLCKDEAVGWYDLDGGLVQYVTLYDLAFAKQPLVTDDGRKLFMMTETMWENEDYPSEVAGRTTSKEATRHEASERKGYYGEPPKEDVFVTQVPRPKAAPPWLAVESTKGGSVLAPGGYVAVRIDMNTIEEILRTDGIDAFNKEPIEESVERVASWIVNTLEGSQTAGSVSTPQETYADALRYFRPRARFLRYKSHAGSFGNRTYGMWAGAPLHSKETIRDLLLSITVVYEGSTVWLYDLEAMKPDRVLTMWELIQDGPIVVGAQVKNPGWYTTETSHRQGAKYYDPHDDKFLWPMSEEQWENGEWPAEDQGGPPAAKYGMEVGR